MRFAIFCALLAVWGSATAATLKVGSKRFTESYILGELIVRTSARLPKKGIVERDGVKFYKPSGAR